MRNVLHTSSKTIPTATARAATHLFGGMTSMLFSHLSCNTTVVKADAATAANGKTEYYTLGGTRLSSPDSVSGVFLQKNTKGSTKVIKKK